MTHRKPLASYRALPVAAALLAALTSFAAAPAARAEILQLSATAFAPRGTAVQAEAALGLLQNATGKYYATVPFPVSGMTVCRFSLWYYDNDAGVGVNVSAKLLRKRVVVGGNAFAIPVTMAQVASAGAVNSMQSASTTAITNPVIAPGIALYFVELNVPSTALQTVGVQIVYKASCP